MTVLPGVRRFQLAVDGAANACVQQLEPLQRIEEPVARLAQRNVIYMEYSMLFLTIGIREARKLHVPEKTITALVVETVGSLVDKIADPLGQTAAGELMAEKKQTFESALKRAQALETMWKNNPMEDAATRFVVLFGLVGKVMLKDVLKRGGDWENKAVRDGIVGRSLEAWKSTRFLEVLGPLAPTT
jgi:hypothetical protein